MPDPNAWLKFFKEWKHSKLAVAATLLAFALGCMGAAFATGVGLQTGKVIIERLSGSSASPSSVPTESAQSICDSVVPIDGETTPGSFMVKGHCVGIEGQDVFVILKDIFPYQTPNQPGTPTHTRYWVQCRTKVQDGGDFLCGVWGCVNQAHYEIVIVVPTAAALADYDLWLGEESNQGREHLPDTGEIRVVGGSRSVQVNHSLGTPSPTCSDRMS